MTRVPFDIPINNDDIYEINENLTLTIDPSLPTGVSVGTPGQATVTIVDDDRKFKFQYCLCCRYRPYVISFY